MSHGGVNAGVVLHEDLVIAVHGKENIDSSKIGRMVGIRKPFKLPKTGEPMIELDSKNEAWRNDESESFTSSPVINKGRVYITVKTGELFCNDASTGKTIWELKLAPDQIHAAPAWGDGKLYVPMFDGHIFVVSDLGDQGKILDELDLGDPCLAPPSIAQGKILIQTKAKLFALAMNQNPGHFDQKELDYSAKSDEVDSLQIIPSEFTLSAGEKMNFRVFALDATGRRIKQLGDGLSWEKWIPPTAKVHSTLDSDLTTTGAGSLSAPLDAKLSAGAVKVRYEQKSAVARVGFFPAFPYKEDFDAGYNLEQKATDGIAFSYPPLPWLGARMRWQIQDLNGEMVAGNTLDRVLFQRAINFVGSWKERDYIVELDAKVDGNRRIKSTVGVINQRYIFALIGNANILQVVSNYDRFQRSVPFSIEANKWYRLKTQIDLQNDGTGLIRAKAWPRHEPEPVAWNLEEVHTHPTSKEHLASMHFLPKVKRKYISIILLFIKKPDKFSTN